MTDDQDLFDEDDFSWIFVDRESFTNAYEVFTMLAELLCELEENIVYDMRDLPSVKRTDLPWQQVDRCLSKAHMLKEGIKVHITKDDMNREYLKRIILNYLPETEFTGKTTFKITNSPVYRKFDDAQKAALYLGWHEARSAQTAILLPKRFQTELFKKCVGYVFIHTADGDKYYLSDSTLILDDTYQMIGDIIYKEKNIEEAIINDATGETYKNNISQRSDEGNERIFRRVFKDQMSKIMVIKDEHVHFRIEKERKAEWLDFLDENEEFNILTDLIINAVDEKIKKLKGIKEDKI